jgi:hypothetical protein
LQHLKKNKAQLNLRQYFTWLGLTVSPDFTGKSMRMPHIQKKAAASMVMQQP